MQFLILTQYFPPEIGAPQARLEAFAKELQRHGHDVTVVTAMPNYPTGVVQPAYKGKFIVAEEISGISVIRTWIYAASGRNTLKRLASYLSFCCTSLIGCLRVPRPDYLLVESPPLFLGVTALFVCWVRRVPFVLIISDLWPASARELGFIRNGFMLWAAERLESFLYRAAFRITGVTEGICRTVAAKVGSRKVMFLPNGVDIDLFHPASNGHLGVVAPDEIGFVYAGTHGYYQGLDTILDAAELLKDVEGIVFALIGDGPEKPRLKREAGNRSLSNVRFYDARPLSDLPAVFANARASIATFRNMAVFLGGRPAKIFPSLACAVPVIFAGAGETAELIASAGCGVTVPPENAAAMAAAVRRFAGDEIGARRMGTAGRALVERDYSWVKIAERWLSQLSQRR